MKLKGFTLIELMVVVAIIAFLAMISVPNFTRFLAKAKRAEAYMHLHAIYASQKAYKAEHGVYSPFLLGKNSIGWKPEGYKAQGGTTTFYYTYGFASGGEGRGHVTGKLKAPASALSNALADNESFVVAAAGDIDGDGTLDILTVDENNTITIVQDDLAH